jgi:hypothetical protein
MWNRERQQLVSVRTPMVATLMSAAECEHWITLKRGRYNDRTIDLPVHDDDTSYVVEHALHLDSNETSRLFISLQEQFQRKEAESSAQYPQQSKQHRLARRQDSYRSGHMDSIVRRREKVQVAASGELTSCRIIPLCRSAEEVGLMLIHGEALNLQEVAGLQTISEVL